MAATNVIALRRKRTFNFYLTLILVYFMLKDKHQLEFPSNQDLLRFIVNFLTKCLRRPITAWTKHRQICLHLPISIDLTIHTDVERQPGPDINVRLRDCLLHLCSNTNLASDVSTYEEPNSRHAFFRNFSRRLVPLLAQTLKLA